ncbi:MAG TPA: fumarylacetoacetate hydrolase family protein [Burkholderiales bacterium]|nr:fumarylacetoacetate hydrolase family protein [Burkholderiales bacterium]
MSKEHAERALVSAMRKHGASAISKASKLLVDARRTRTLAATGGVVLHTEAEAYSVQDAVFAALWSGARPAAWKAGGPSDKVEPTAAPIPPENLLRSPASIAGATMQMIGVEAEVAFRFARDLPPRTRPYSEKAVAAAVGEVLVAIELCDTRLADWKKSSGLWKLADFQNNSALVVGSGTRDWQKIDFLQQEVEFRVGARVAKAKGAHSFGNPFRLLPWITAHCARRGLGMQAGDVVTTGAWTGLELAKAGDEVTARFPGIGEATVQIN